MLILVESMVSVHDDQTCEKSTGHTLRLGLIRTYPHTLTENINGTKGPIQRSLDLFVSQVFFKCSFKTLSCQKACQYCSHTLNQGLYRFE